MQAAAAPVFHKALLFGFSFDQSEPGGSVDAHTGWSVTRMGGGGSDDYSSKKEDENADKGVKVHGYDVALGQTDGRG
jgi:hypothetical protein